jgi:hypothetical protein
MGVSDGCLRWVSPMGVSDGCAGTCVQRIGRTADCTHEGSDSARSAAATVRGAPSPTHHRSAPQAALRSSIHHPPATTHRPHRLTTFSDVPWNRPLYEHLGFVVLAPEAVGPELQAVIQRESDGGPDHAPRVCMGVGMSISMAVER